MRITTITTEEYRWPRHKPISNGLHTYTHAGLALVKIETDEGITGIGLGGGGTIGRATIETLKPELIGEDPIDVERLWHKMWIPKLIGRRGLTTRAISAHRHRALGYPRQGRRACRSTSCSAASATGCRPTSPAATTRRARGSRSCSRR